MWAKVAEELAVPWRAAEAMHWQLGEQDMARRAGVTPFSLAAVNSRSNVFGGRDSQEHSMKRTPAAGATPPAPTLAPIQGSPPARTSLPSIYELALPAARIHTAQESASNDG